MRGSPPVLPSFRSAPQPAVVAASRATQSPRRLHPAKFSDASSRTLVAARFGLAFAARPVRLGITRSSSDLASKRRAQSVSMSTGATSARPAWRRTPAAPPGTPPGPGRLRMLRLELVAKAPMAVSASARAAACRTSRNARCARGRRRWGSLSSTLAILGHQSRCGVVPDQTSRTAPQKPSAPARAVPTGAGAAARSTSSPHFPASRPQWPPAPSCRPTAPEHRQRIQPVVFQAPAAVGLGGPHVDEVADGQIPAPERLARLAPGGRQPCDVRGSQARRILAQQRGQRLAEAPDRQTAQRQHRQHFSHLRRPPQVRRQNPAREPLPLAVVGNPPVVAAGSANLQRSPLRRLRFSTAPGHGERPAVGPRRRASRRAS